MKTKVMRELLNFNVNGPEPLTDHARVNRVALAMRELCDWLDEDEQEREAAAKRVQALYPDTMPSPNSVIGMTDAASASSAE